MVEVISVEKFKEDVFDFTTSTDWSYDKEQPLILNFFATWCGPCHMFAPTLEDIAEQYEGKLKVYKIDIDAQPAVAALFGVRSVPTTLFISRGEEPALASGTISRENMDRAIKELLGVS